MAWDKVEAKAEVVGAQIFQLCINLLSNKSCQHWDKIFKVQMDTSPWEVLKGEL